MWFRIDARRTPRPVESSHSAEQCQIHSGWCLKCPSVPWQDAPHCRFLSPSKIATDFPKSKWKRVRCFSINVNSILFSDNIQTNKQYWYFFLQSWTVNLWQGHLFVLGSPRRSSGGQIPLHEGIRGSGNQSTPVNGRLFPPVSGSWAWQVVHRKQRQGVLRVTLSSGTDSQSMDW